jgi:lipopolysaccharide heptosyltransferase II
LKILLVRLRQIGDVVFTTPAVGALRQRFPDAHISYIVEPAAAPVVANNPNIDEIIVAPRRRFPLGAAGELALIRRLRRARFDVAIDFHGGPRASLLTWLSGAPVRVGYEVAARSWMYTRRVGRPRTLRARHSVVNQWDLLAPFEIAPPQPATAPVEMPVDAGAAAAVEARLADAGVGQRERLIVIHVSAGNPFRRWPIASFAAVAADLAASDDRHRVVITSGPSEHDAAARVIAEARTRLDGQARDRLLDCGEFSIAELRALVDGASLYIGGDSGPLHVAATSRVPIVALYGPTLPARSFPWRPPEFPAASIDAGPLPCRPCDQRTCEPGDFRCLMRIEPAQVAAAARQLIAVSNAQVLRGAPPHTPGGPGSHGASGNHQTGQNL